MMTSQQKAEKAREILLNDPSDEDTLIAVGLAKEAAADNNAMGLFLLGNCYLIAEGVKQDEQKALELCQKALDMGYERAKRSLALLYIQGKVVEHNLPLAEQYLRDCMAKDDEDAWLLMGHMVQHNAFPHISPYECIDYYRKAAEMGEKHAFRRMGEAYCMLCEPEQAEYWFQKAEKAGVKDVGQARAQYTEEDYPMRREELLHYYIEKEQYDKAFALVGRDAEHGDEAALLVLAGYYQQGLGEQRYGRDLQKALQIYEKMVAEGDPWGHFLIGLMYATVEEMIDHRRAVEYVRKAAEANLPEALHTMGRFCFDAYAEEQDMDKAKEWFERAAAEGYPDSLYVLAASYLQDDEVAKTYYPLDYGKDEKYGLQLMQRAAKEGSDEALLALSYCRQMGKYMEQNERKAFELLDESCRQKLTPEKANLLGDAYLDGKGVEQDYEQALECYQWAANNGNAVAALSLSKMYKNGLGVEQNDEMAMTWLSQGLQLFNELKVENLTRRAENGDSQAMLDLGNCYHVGDCVKQNTEVMLEWWKKAAEAGELAGLHNIGYYYYEQRDIPNAMHYLSQAVEKGYLESYYTLAFCYLRRDEPEDGEKGIELLNTAAERGLHVAQVALSGIYHDGKYADKDYDKARYWQEKALAADLPEAYYQKGISLLCGDMYEKDSARALEHFRKAVEGGCHDADRYYIDMRWNGNESATDRDEVVAVYKNLADNDNDVEAQFQLYSLYKDTSYEGYDVQAAGGYLQRSANAGHVKAILYMGLEYWNGNLFPVDNEKAYHCFVRAKEMGDMTAKYCLAYCYEHGLGVDKDIHKAEELYIQAAEEGEKWGAIGLSNFYIHREKEGIEPDYDKAIRLLELYLEEENPAIYTQMALTIHSKCMKKNAYSWEEEVQAFEWMQKAAEAGHPEAMERLADWYVIGVGTLTDMDEAKQWQQKYIDNGGTLADEKNLLSLTDDELEEYSWYDRLVQWKEVVEKNIGRIENPLEMTTTDGDMLPENILLNVAQTGYFNAAVTLGLWGLRELKSDPEKAKQYIAATCKAGVGRFAAEAGREWLKEGLDNEKAIVEAGEYFAMGMDANSPDCFLETGLLLTDSRIDYEEQEDECMEIGKKCLQAVVELDDDWEELRQQARTRLEEIARRHTSLWRKIKKGFGSKSGKK